MDGLSDLAWYYLSWEIPSEEEGGEEGDLEGRLERLNEWFEAGGGRGAGRAKMMSVQRRRAGLVAGKTVPRGGAYLEIPWEMVMGRAKALEWPELQRVYERAYELVTRHNDRDDRDVASLNVLLCCYLLFRAPAPYVEALPRSFDGHPLLRQLKLEDDGTAWSAARREARASLRSFVVLCRCCARDADLPEVPRARYVWAYLIWTTRLITVSLPDTPQSAELAFVPLVDMTNCRANGDCSRTVKESDDFAVIRTSEAIPEGAEINENYGWANFDYFLYHGFFHHQNNDDEEDFFSKRDLFVCRPVLLGRRSRLLDVLLGPRRGGTLFPRRRWIPRLAEDMRFVYAADEPDFDPKWPFDRFNAEWQADRNHAFLVAVALECEDLFTDEDFDGDSVASFLARVASPRAVANAWRRLASLATQEVKALEVALNTYHHRHQKDELLVVPFYESQRRLGLRLIDAFGARASSCLEPPPYNGTTCTT